MQEIETETVAEEQREALISLRIALDIDSMDTSPDRLLDGLEWVDRTANLVAGYRSRIINTLRLKSDEAAAEDPTAGRVIARRALTSEIATTLHLSERAAENLIGVSAVLHDTLPGAAALLAAGTMSWRHVQVLVEHAADLDPDRATELERRVLGRAGTTTPSQFGSLVRRSRERLDPVAIENRHETAMEKRAVMLDEGRDGMEWLNANLSATHAQAIYDRLTTAALAKKAQGDPRTIAQLRADILTAVLLAYNNGAYTNGVGGDAPEIDDSDNFIRWFRGIVPTVIVSVPVLSLLGVTDEPATLEGHGPLDLRTARILAGRATSWIRVLTHPETGAVLSVGRSRYKVPKDLRIWLLIRDGTCRFPGCRRRAERCDIDHTAEWQHQGETGHANLAHLCRWHHTLKSTGWWGVEQDANGNGTLTWTSPAGRTTTTHPETQLPF